MPPRNRSTGVKVWGRRTGLRHVHDQDRPELLFRCRKPATLNFTGRKWGSEKWPKAWAESLPSATNTLFAYPTAVTTKEKWAYFYLSPGNRNVNPRKAIMWVKMPMIFQSEVKERALDPPIVLAHTKPRGVLEQPGIRNPKTTGNNGVGGGEFHPGIYPKAAALLRLTGQPGEEGLQRSLAYSKSQGEDPPANHSRPHLGGQPASSVLSHRRQPSGKPEPKHIVMKGGLGKRATWKCCYGSPSFLLPLAPTWKRKTEQGQSGTA